MQVWQKSNGPFSHKSAMNQRRSTEKKAMDFKNIYQHLSHTDTTGHHIYSTMHVSLFQAQALRTHVQIAGVHSMFCWSRTWEYYTWPWYWIEPNGELCAMYGKPKLTHVNEARYATFQLNYASRNDREPLQKIKGTNASMLPPCQSALFEKVRRTNFVAAVWKGTSEPEPCSLSRTENGWILVDGSYKMKWFEGDKVPRDVWWILDADTEALEEQMETDTNDPLTYELLYGSDDYLDFDEYWSNNFDDYCSISYRKYTVWKFCIRTEPFRQLHLYITV